MSAADSTDAPPTRDAVPAAAARGRLPEWAVAGPERREHVRRVAALMDEWADALELPPAERLRWRTAAWLHDALRDADPAALRAALADGGRGCPDPLLHGPAAAERLRGVVDEEVEDAIRYHTVGHPSFGELGRALYLADFLEPGREFLAGWRASLRDRMPRERDRVLVEVLAARITHLLERRTPIRPETIAFWNALVEGLE